MSSHFQKTSIFKENLWTGFSFLSCKITKYSLSPYDPEGLIDTSIPTLSPALIFTFPIYGWTHEQFVEREPITKSSSELLVILKVWKTEPP